MIDNNGKSNKCPQGCIIDLVAVSRIFPLLGHWLVYCSVWSLPPRHSLGRKRLIFIQIAASDALHLWPMDPRAPDQRMHYPTCANCESGILMLG